MINFRQALSIKLKGIKDVNISKRTPPLTVAYKYSRWACKMQCKEINSVSFRQIRHFTKVFKDISTNLILKLGDPPVKMEWSLQFNKFKFILVIKLD